MLADRGMLARLFRPLFRIISASWHMYPVGLLFALGFDTATEIGLLGVAASQTAQGLSLWSILIVPALFTAGMVLVAPRPVPAPNPGTTAPPQLRRGA
jgi:high-affinity nickel-transport protein